jgi:hypothetical protein
MPTPVLPEQFTEASLSAALRMMHREERTALTDAPIADAHVRA